MLQLHGANSVTAQCRVHTARRERGGADGVDCAAQGTHDTEGDGEGTHGVADGSSNTLRRRWQRAKSRAHDMPLLAMGLLGVG
jgi:hypothetical protein